mgnify:CR=1 FL=1
MNTPLLLSGSAGTIELFLDHPNGIPQGIALLGHPHPLMGGTAEHKVLITLSKALQERGYLVARPNFRGVGQSSGSHDHGIGETSDMEEILEWMRSEYPGLPLVLGGFSFGAWIAARLQERLQPRNITPVTTILTGTAVGKVDSGRDYHTPHLHGEALIIHGANDDIIRLNAVLDWANEQDRAIVVIPAADHFFNRKQQVLQQVISHHLDRILIHCR